MTAIVNPTVPTSRQNIKICAIICYETVTCPARAFLHMNFTVMVKNCYCTIETALFSQGESPVSRPQICLISNTLNKYIGYQGQVLSNQRLFLHTFR